MTKPKLSHFIILIFIAGIAAGPFYAQSPVATSPTWDVYFSPRGGATVAIRHALDNAKSEVLVHAYSFTPAPIAEALVKAHRRGVKVQVLLDKSQRTEKYSSADFLANAGTGFRFGNLMRTIVLHRPVTCLPF